MIATIVGLDRNINILMFSFCLQKFRIVSMQVSIPRQGLLNPAVSNGEVLHTGKCYYKHKADVPCEKTKLVNRI